MVGADSVIAEEQTVTRAADAVVACVRACAAFRAVWMEHLWKDGLTSPDQGLAISPGEVRRILADPQIEFERFKKFMHHDEPARLEREADAAIRALNENQFWIEICRVFGLTHCEADFLALCAAVELSPRLGRVLAYLADDTRATQPTIEAAAALFAWSDGPVAEMTGLVRWKLACPVSGEAGPRATSPWQADESVLASLKAERWVEPSLDRAAHFVEPQEVHPLPCLYPDVLKQMLNELSSGFLETVEEESDAALVGPEGSGRESLASQFAAALGRKLMPIKAAMLRSATPEAKVDAMIRAARLARATHSVLYWRDADAVTAAEWSELKAIGTAFLRGTQNATDPAAHRYTLPPLSTAQRLEVWTRFSDAQPPSIVLAQRLTPAEIRIVARSASEEAIHAGLRQVVKSHAELMQILPRPYTWDDLVVTPSLERVLKDFEAQVQLRWQVYEEWGFSRLTHLGKGISALFGGPSGTGKTMAAQVLARSLGLELCRVDLAGVVNKYIGETEKRLRDVFDVCERSGALLFFDEADALFGNRMQVKDSHDRFANIEIDYLLQRIEQFDGIAILATNRKNDLDSAFLRRLRFVMDFVNPDRPQRLAIWQKALPPLTPAGERIVGDIDFNLLADELEITGAQIKAIALGAAFIARSENKQIGMDHIELAAHREYAKTGQLLRADFSNSRKR